MCLQDSFFGLAQFSAPVQSQPSRTNNRVAVVTAAFGSNPSVHATGGDGTAVDLDGTQGDFTDAVQGTTDSDGDQDAFLTTSEEAAPQLKAPHK